MDEVPGAFAISDIQSSPLEIKSRVNANCVRLADHKRGDWTPLLAMVKEACRQQPYGGNVLEYGSCNGFVCYEYHLLFFPCC